MGTRYSTKLVFKTLFLLLVILLSGLASSGCIAGTAAVSSGWSGVVIDNDILFVGSMEGKLVAANTTDGRSFWEATLESTVSTGGGFGCAPASKAVAIYSSPAVAKDLVYVGGYTGIIYAFAVGKDEPRWVYPRQGALEGYIVGGPIVGEGKVYFGCADGKVYALDAADGYKENGWPFETGDKIWSTPTISEDTLYIGSLDKKLYALNANDGSKKWEFKTEGAIVSTPLVYDNKVYFGSFDRYLYAIDATSGSLKWKFLAENWFWAKAVVYNDTIYAACLDGKVYALNAESGNKLAEPLDLGSPISSSPVLVDDLLIVATEEGVVYAIDTKSNQQRQLANVEGKVYAPLAASQGKVYVHTRTDALYEIDAQSGATLWSISLKSAPPPSSQQSSSGTNWGLLIAVVVGGIVLIMVFQVLRRRRAPK
jgi:outer membrane protein assembly factor BamB